MPTSLAQLKSKHQLPDRSGESKEYLIWTGHGFIRLRWSEMTLHQRRQEIEAEKRAAYVAMYDPCGILF